MKMLLVFIGGVAAVLLIMSLLAIGSDMMGIITGQAIDDAVSQLNEDSSASAKQLSINVCAGLNIGSCNNEQDSVATTVTEPKDETPPEPPSPWPIIIGLTLVIGIVVLFALSIFSSNSL